jgi:hypothetical protein
MDRVGIRTIELLKCVRVEKVVKGYGAVQAIYYKMEEIQMKEIILTDKAQQPGNMPYSQAVKVGNTIYVAGQGPF